MARRSHKTLTSSISKSQQDVVLLELVELPSMDPNGAVHKLRLRVRSNAYSFQGSASIERWDGNEWQQVWSIPAGAMETEEGLYALPEHRPADRSAFNLDASRLLDAAKLILS